MASLSMAELLVIYAATNLTKAMAKLPSKAAYTTILFESDI